MLSKILKYLFIYGIAWGSTLFILHGITHEIFMGLSMNQNFTIRAIAFIVIGIGTGSSTVVYTFEQLKPWQQQAIHATISLITLLVIFISINWVHTHSTTIIITTVVTIIFSFFVGWSGFYFYKKHEAKKINDMLKKLNKEHLSR